MQRVCGTLQEQTECGAVRVKAASAPRTGAGPGAGKQGSWREEEDSEPKSGPWPGYVGSAGAVPAIIQQLLLDNAPGQVLGDICICVVWGLRGKLLTPPEGVQTFI